jgi:Flp pilus assembly protein TadB
MNRYYTERPASTAAYVAGAFALGALAMYLLDPVQGNRRRALIRDKTYSAARKTRKMADAASTDVANRAKGMAAELRRAARRMPGMQQEAGSMDRPNGPA